MSTKDDGPVVGVDFGTTGFRIAFLDGEVARMVEVPGGNSTVPSDVLLRVDGSVEIGTSARREGPHDGSLVVHAAKRVLGRTWNDPAVAELKQELGDALVESDGGLPSIVVGGRAVSPEQVCQLMFARIKAIASAALKEEVSRIVLAVPADYGLIQRKALSRVTAEAGLRVIRFVAEPTAAAIYRAAGATNRIFAVYDLGGGTFDISIVEVDDGVYQVLASDGDPLLGGEDIDLRLMAHVLAQAEIDAGDVAPASLFKLRNAVEAVKRELSSSLRAMLSVDGLKKGDGSEFIISRTIDRDVIQDISQDLIDRTLVICNRALDLAASYTEGPFGIDKIDEVVLVGGSTHLPFVEDCVARFFGKELGAPNRREDSVALGCALYGGMLSGELKWPLVLDVTPRAYGIQIDDEPAVGVIPKNASSPARKQVVLSSAPGGSGRLTVRVFEGEIELSAVNPTVGVVELNPVRDSHGSAELAFTLHVDANGEIDLETWDVHGRTAHQVRLEPSPAVLGKIATTDGESRPVSIGETQPRRHVRRRSILAVATEWSSGAGGLSTFNRELCLALSAAGHDVRCLVKTADLPERQSAEDGNVMLIEATRSPGQSEDALLNRKPRMPDDWTPDLVIGHGRITGPAAAAIVEDHYTQADRMHLFHMAPDEIEWLKDDREDDAGARAEERTRTERQLGVDARYAVAVGPKLYDRYFTEFSGEQRRPLRLDPGFDSRGTTPIGPPGGKPLRVLFVGRAEDETLKGLDIAAAALGELMGRWRGPEIELIVRGAPAGASGGLRSRLLAWAGETGLKVVVRPFSPNADDLAGDYRRASLVLMPSRTEGFGLVGLEAICAGVPVLVSSESGLAGLLKERLEDGDYNKTVVPVRDALDRDKVEWAAAIQTVLSDLDAAFSNSARLQEMLGQSASWAASISELERQMG